MWKSFDEGRRGSAAIEKAGSTESQPGLVIGSMMAVNNHLFAIATAGLMHPEHCIPLIAALMLTPTKRAS